MNSGTETKKDAKLAADAAGLAMSASAPTVATAAPATASDSAVESPVTPVRSAKDAINAMYAQDSQHRLSNYLASSAKAILNANKSTSEQKSAANLHHGSNRRQIETVRPSASGLLKTAKVKEVIIPSDTSAAMDPVARQVAPATPKRVVRTVKSVATPVVKTSLKLGPKKAPTTIAPQNIRQNRLQRESELRSQKGSTALAEMLAKRKAEQPVAVAGKAAQRPATAKSTAPTPAVARPKTRAPRGLMQDVIRPTRPVRPTAPAPAPTTTPAPASHRHPFDSIKRRFRAAPKDFTAVPETQAAGYTSYSTAVGNDYDVQPPQPSPESLQKPPVEIYGLMDEEPTGKRSDGLGVVEDYQPKGGLTEQKIAQGSGNPASQGNHKSAPNNNRYALGGQSPFFLKSVNVEKRPLSDAPSKRSKDLAGTLYEQPGSEPLGRKNVYNAPESKKALPTKPTVIIPASRRSKAPLVFLLLLTVVLGAAVGGFIYLFFFQYME